ncbi:hypothetical protein [Siminovitchia fordii]|uniref:hypothetical protein n=1 Tax=Siminovitchia fordii TaxID=254759 RepID=UPI000371688C|nr:hypothetical protein [Siminovitchia fordii]
MKWRKGELGESLDFGKTAYWVFFSDPRFVSADGVPVEMAEKRNVLRRLVGRDFFYNEGTIEIGIEMYRKSIVLTESQVYPSLCEKH